jgi:hypothetical protein
VRITRYVVAMVAALSMTALVAVPASAQPEQNGLVNIIVDDVTVQVPVSVAANICDVNVGILAAQLDVGDTNCTATSESTASRGPDGGGGMSSNDGQGPDQDGLVNVIITDVTAQVPISIAANVCDVNVGVLARQLRAGETDCQADAVSLARVRDL